MLISQLLKCCLVLVRPWKGHLLKRVIHIVVNRVFSSILCARVTASRASRGSRSRSRSVGDGITGTGASTLESVHESEPMSDFVGDGFTLVEVHQASARDSSVQNLTAIKIEVVWAGRDISREIAKLSNLLALEKTVKREGNILQNHHRCCRGSKCWVFCSLLSGVFSS